MAREAPGPLTEKDYTMLQNALHALGNTNTEVGMALRAGLDCQQEQDLCQDLQRRLAQIKAVYFPQHP